MKRKNVFLVNIFLIFASLMLLKPRQAQAVACGCCYGDYNCDSSAAGCYTVDSSCSDSFPYYCLCPANYSCVDGECVKLNCIYSESCGPLNGTWYCSEGGYRWECKFKFYSYTFYYTDGTSSCTSVNCTNHSAYDVSVTKDGTGSGDNCNGFWVGQCNNPSGGATPTPTRPPGATPTPTPRPTPTPTPRPTSTPTPTPRPTSTPTPTPRPTSTPTPTPVTTPTPTPTPTITPTPTPSPTPTPTPIPTGSIGGYVWEDTDTSCPVGGSKYADKTNAVRLNPGDIFSNTDGDGYYEFTSLSLGAYNVTVIKGDWSCACAGGNSGACVKSVTLDAATPDVTIDLSIVDVRPGWFQVIDGDIHANGNISNMVP